MGEFNVNKSDGSLEQTAGMPDTYPATQVMMSDGVTSVEDRVDAHTVGTAVALTLGSDYVATADGYLNVRIATGSNLYVRGYADGVQLITLQSTNAVLQESSVFIKKGTTIKFSGSNSTDATGFFYPLQ